MEDAICNKTLEITTWQQYDGCMKYIIAVLLLIPTIALAQSHMTLGIENKPKEGGGFYNNEQTPNPETVDISPKFELKNNDEITAFHVFKACRKYFESTFNTRENIARRAICNGYFFGLGSTLMSLRAEGIKIGACLPGDLTTEQVIHTFLDWTKLNESKLNNSASSGAIAALRDKYSCKKQKISNLYNKK